jgi:hypothetical protein
VYAPATAKEIDMGNTWHVQGPQPANGEPMSCIVPLLVTGLCVVVGILLAALDGSFDGSANVRLLADASHAPAVTRTPITSAEHRKQVFDERRARFDAATRVRAAAAPTATAPTVHTSP